MNYTKFKHNSIEGLVSKANYTIEFEFDGKTFKLDLKKQYRCSQYAKSSGFTPLMLLITEPLKFNCNNEKLNKYILDNQDTIDMQNNEGWSALMMTCGNWCDPEIVKMLINAGADLNLTNSFGYTALMFASHYNTPEIVSLLINAGAKLDLQDKDNDTALTLTICNRFKDHIVELLMKGGANMKIRNKAYMVTGFEIVCSCLSEELVKYCFDTHKYYDEKDLILCIKIGKYQKLLASYLAKLYFEKISFIRNK